MDAFGTVCNFSIFAGNPCCHTTCVWWKPQWCYGSVCHTTRSSKTGKWKLNCEWRGVWTGLSHSSFSYSSLTSFQAICCFPRLSAIHCLIFTLCPCLIKRAFLCDFLSDSLAQQESLWKIWPVVKWSRSHQGTCRWLMRSNRLLGWMHPLNNRFMRSYCTWRYFMAKEVTALPVGDARYRRCVCRKQLNWLSLVNHRGMLNINSRAGDNWENCAFVRQP